MVFNINMKIIQNLINFNGNAVSYKVGKHKIVDYFDNKIMTKKMEYDEFDRIIDTKWFDIEGNVVEHLHKDYYENSGETGFIEHFKNKTQEYIRKSYTKFESNLKHNVDEFQSISSPSKSYINEFIYDMQNQLIQIINNGKIKKI